MNTCTDKNHKILADLLYRGLSYGPHYNGDFSCSACKKVILSIRDGIRILPNKSPDADRVKVGSVS